MFAGRDMNEMSPTLRSELAYLPAELVLAGLALAVYGLRPRLFGFAWAGYAVITFIAFLGPDLKLRQWVLDISPTTHVGNTPVTAIQTGALTVMTGAAAALVAVGFLAFRRRGIPQGEFPIGKVLRMAKGPGAVRGGVSVIPTIPTVVRR